MTSLRELVKKARSKKLKKLEKLKKRWELEMTLKDFGDLRWNPNREHPREWVLNQLEEAAFLVHQHIYGDDSLEGEHTNACKITEASLYLLNSARMMLIEIEAQPEPGSALTNINTAMDALGNSNFAHDVKDQLMSPGDPAAWRGGQNRSGPEHSSSEEDPGSSVPPLLH